jgi:hypothetical protein
VQRNKGIPSNFEQEAKKHRARSRILSPRLGKTSPRHHKLGYFLIAIVSKKLFNQTDMQARAWAGTTGVPQ